MKMLKLCLPVFLLFFMFSASLTAAPPVVGTDTYPDDVDNVQAAVDQGGTVYLEGTFNFGVNEEAPYIDSDGNPKYTRVKEKSGFTPTALYDPNSAFWGGVLPRSVFITNDVTIIGNNAVIKGGYKPFVIGMTQPSTFTVLSRETYWHYDMDYDGGLFFTPEGAVTEPVEVSIQGIEFQNPLFNAIWIVASKDSGMIDINNNTFYDGMTLAWGLWNPGYRIARAIHIEPIGYFTLPPYPDSTIQGTIRIADNRVYGNSRTDTQRTFTGISHFIYGWYINVDLGISDNTIEDIGMLGIALGGLWKTTVISDNIISAKDSGLTGISISEAGYGGALGLPFPFEGDEESSRTIITDNTLNVPNGKGISFLTKNKHVLVADNTIENAQYGVAQPLFPLNTDPELSWISSSTIQNNTFKVTGVSALELQGNSIGNSFVRNVIIGEADYGVTAGAEVVVGPGITLKGAPTHNTFYGNYFRGLTTSVAQIYLGEDASDNIIQRNSFGKLAPALTKGAVVIEGDNNTLGADPDAPYFYYYRYVLRNDYRRCNKFGGAPGLPGGPACVLLTDTSQDNTVVEFGLWPIYTWNQIDDRGDNWIYYYWR